jgi:hypothetical protein
MVKITQDTAIVMLTLLLDMEERGVTISREWESAYERLHKAQRKGPENRPNYDIIDNLMRRLNVREVPPTKDAIVDLHDQILADREADGEGTKPLMEQVVEVLMDPYARNTLGRDHLRRMRRILLTDNEAAQVRTEVDAKVKRCAQCDHEFQQYEVVAYGGNEAFGCARCLPMAAVRCSAGGCEDYAAMPKGLRCHAHQQENKKRPTWGYFENILNGVPPIAGIAGDHIVFDDVGVNLPEVPNDEPR